MVVLVIDWSSGVKLSSRSSSSVSGGSDMDTTGSPGLGSLIRASSFELIFLTSLAVSWSTLRYWIQHMLFQSSPNSVFSCTAWLPQVVIDWYSPGEFLGHHTSIDELMPLIPPR